MRKDEEQDSSDEFFNADEGLVVDNDRHFLHGASESGQSGGGTENDVMPSAHAQLTT